MANKILFLIPLVLFVLMIGIGATLSNATGGGGGETASTSQCSAGQYSYNVTESDVGIMTTVCSAVQWGQLVNFPSGTGGCSSGSAFVYALNTTNYYCSKVSFAQLTNYPAACSVNKFATGVNSTNFQCSSVAWAALTGFPAGCSANQWVTAVGSTLTCTTVQWGQLANFPTGSGGCSSADIYVYKINSTNFYCSAVTYSGITSFPTGSGGCSSNDVPVYKINSTNFYCAQITWTGLGSFPTGSGCGGNTFVFKINTTNYYCSTVTAGSVAWSNITGFPTGSGGCASQSSFVFKLNATNYYCSQVSWGNLINFPTGSGGCAANSVFVYKINATNYYCSGLTWANILSIPTGSGGCAVNNEFVYKINATNYYCSKVSFANLSNFPSSCSANQYATGINGTNMICATVQWNQLGGFPTGSGGCAVNSEFVYKLNSTNYYCSTVSWSNIASFPTGSGGCAINSAFVYKINSTNYYCSTVSFANLTNLPSGCSANQYATAITSSSLTCSQVGWTQLTGFPASCGANNYVQVIAATITCRLVNQGFNQTGLQLYSQLDEGTGTVVYDLSFNHVVGSAVGTPAWLSGSSCMFQIKCLNMSATIGQDVLLGHSYNDSQNFAITMCVWYYPNSAPTSGHTFNLFGDETNVGGTFAGYSFIYNANNTFGVARFNLGASVTTFSTPLSYAINSWYFVCFSYNNPTLAIEVNGVLVASASSAFAISKNPTPYQIGNTPVGSSGGTGFTNGRFSTLYQYNYALSNSSNLALYEYVPNPTEQTPVLWSQLTGFPSSCPANQYASAVGATLTCSQVGWTQLTNFPAACPAGQFVTTIGSSITCSTVSGTSSITMLSSSATTNKTAPTLVQNTFATATTGTSFNKAFATNLGKNNMIMACEGQSTASTAMGAPTDTLSSTFIAQTVSSATSDATVQCWTAMTIAGGADTVTTGTFGTSCSATNLCALFIYEVNGADFAQLIGAGNQCIFSSTSTTTTPACGTTFTTLASYSPLFLTVEMKATAGTDTAGTNFALANGETGSLKYLTQKSTSVTGTTTTCPATFGTTSTYAAVCFAIGSYYEAFKISLSANTNYKFQSYIQLTQPSTVGGSTLYYFIRQFNNTGVTSSWICGAGAQGSFSGCQSSVDNASLTTVTGISNKGTSAEVFGQVQVGANPVTLVICFDVDFTSPHGLFTFAKGSYIEVQAG